jgi:hypothetical protein
MHSRFRRELSRVQRPGVEFIHLNGSQVCREFPEDPFRDDEMQTVKVGEEPFRRGMGLPQTQEENVGVEPRAFTQDGHGGPSPRAPCSTQR